MFYFKSVSYVSSCINEIHIFCFPSKLSFRFPFHSVFHSVPFSVPRFSNVRPDSNEIYNLGRAFLGHYSFILHLSDPCPSVDKNRRRNIACSLYDHALAQEPLPGRNYIYNFGRPFLDYHYYTLSLSDLCHASATTISEM